MGKVIKVDNISKAYQLGDFGTGTISRDLERFWARVRGKEDPFLRIGEANDRTKKGESDIVWSLRNINFEIEKGDAVGIIGRNGAGKSTLLKVLSRVTSPTTGSIKVKGRIASLLEVGTGFHPELTGEENIYLNGAILGMRKAEIKRKFDEIVDFAGVERYIDTPVKRYSSGMYVRLAFAVAAHLEAEILIVDEVLAVGDAEFQKKCLGKMGDVSKGEGKTVLFVSHNMGSIRQLCNKGVLLSNGEVFFQGNTENTIKTYMSNDTIAKSGITAMGTLSGVIKIKSVTVNDNPLDVIIVPGEEIKICVIYESLSNLPAFRLSVSLFKDGVRILTLQDIEESRPITAGVYQSTLTLPQYFLRPGVHNLSVGGHNADYASFPVGDVQWVFAPDIFSFEILEDWSIRYDFNNTGLINVSNTISERKQLS